MISPESGLMLVPTCSFKVTVLSVVGVHLMVVGSPEVKSYPPLGTLNGLSVWAATRAAKALTAT